MSDATHPPREARGGDRGRLAAHPRGYRHASPPNNLPSELSSFVGREKELAEVKRLLKDTRLLTLTGSGGCGKTRLAVVAAGELAEGFEDGVWLVELAPLVDPSLVPQAVTSVLGAREQPGRSLTETLSDYLGTRKVLLVLDNCEHLIEACADLAEALLRSCPELRVLTTSREALGIVGEVAWPVPSLSLPDLRRLPDVESLPRYESARLFVERAVAVKPSFGLTEQNAASVAQVCYRLDGIPLALELAAARARVLSVEQISERLDDSFGLLVAGGRTAMPRQRTLQATMDWSHELLSEEERTLFRRSSVFSGGFSLEAAESVCAGEEIERYEVLELLSHLVDKSLVVARERDGEARYRLLEMMRQYGREKLEESGEARQVRERHAGYYLALAEEAEPELKGAGQVAWLERFEREHDNLRAAISWSLERSNLRDVARLGWALWLFWWIRGHFAEGRRLMEQALSVEGSAMPASARAQALFVAGTMACGQGDHRSADLLLEESADLFRELGDGRGVAYALGSAAVVAITEERYEQGIVYSEEATDLFLEVGDRWGAAPMLGCSAVGWLNRGDPRRAKGLAERGLALCRETGDKHGTSIALGTLARVAQAERGLGSFFGFLVLTRYVGVRRSDARGSRGGLRARSVLRLRFRDAEVDGPDRRRLFEPLCRHLPDASGKFGDRERIVLLLRQSSAGILAGEGVAQPGRFLARCDVADRKPGQDEDPGFRCHGDSRERGSIRLFRSSLSWHQSVSGNAGREVAVSSAVRLAHLRE